MSDFKQKVRTLEFELKQRIEIVVGWHGKQINGTKGIKLKRDFFVEGRQITHVTAENLIADGLEYQHHCLPIDELADLVDSLG